MRTNVLGGGNFSCTHPKLWEYIKSNVKAFFITGAIVFTISASATTVKILHSRQVRYKNDKSVEHALNELYENAEQAGKIVGCSGCTKLEYLESTGTQYINTGVNGSFDDKIEFEGEFSLNGINPTKEQALLGDKNSSNEGLTIFFPESTSKLSTWCGAGTTYKVTDLEVNNKNIFKSIFYKNKGRKIVLNNTEYVNDNVLNKITDSQETFGLFSDKSTSLNSASRIRMYSLKIKKDESLLRDFIPVLDSNDRPALFDKVEKKLYYSLGVDDFAISPIPQQERDLQFVNYIKGNGTQYIDTGVIGTFNNKIEFEGEFSLNSINTNQEQALLGDKNSSNQGLTVFFPSSTTKLSTWCGDGTTYRVVDLEVDDKNKFEITFFKTSGRKVIINGVEYNNGVMNSVTNSQETFGLFSDKSTSLNSPANMTLFNIKIKKDDSLVRDYIPSLDKKERPCLFDKVEKKCYYNQGTGEFLYG